VATAAVTQREAARPASRLRDHWLLVVLVALGALLRVLVMVGYRPALLFPDAFRYLLQSQQFYFSTTRPGGYSLVLWPLRHLTDSLTPITLGQHLLGLGMAVACYAFLRRRGLGGTWAAVAVAPVLLDPLQLTLEHYVLSDVLFETLLVSACLVLLWRHRPGAVTLAVVGALVGCAGLVRGAGSFVLAVFVVAVLCLRLPWWRLAAFLVAAVLPLGAYVVGYHAEHDKYAVVESGPQFLYARLAPFISCDRAELPTYERLLCPTEPVGRRPDTNYYMWGRGAGPAYHVRAPQGMTRMQVLKDFDKRVIRAEPLVYARVVAKEALGGFSPSRAHEVPGYPASYWLFEDHNWSLDGFPRWAAEYGPQYHLSQQNPAAGFMAVYRRVLHTPGPLLLLLLLACAAAAAGVGRARWSGVRVAVGLLAGCCAVVIGTGTAFSGFSWRYQLPQVPLIPVAGALAVAALVRGPAPGAPAPLPPLLLLDRVAGGRRRGPLATLAAVLAAVLVAILAAGSGWAAWGTAVVLGVVAGLLVAFALLRRPVVPRPVGQPDDG
jgi:hypothetical protein